MNRKAFTVIELLVVIMVLGVLVTLVTPMITSGSDASRVRTATRGIMQMSRYSRTMAVLHQNAVELTFYTNGKLTVTLEGGGKGNESIVSARSFAVTNAVGAAEEARMAEIEAAHDDSSGGKGKAYSMADVNVDKEYEQVRFTFLGYTDTADAGRYSHLLSPAKDTVFGEAGEDGDSVRTERVRYKSNGTVRPYRVKVSGDGDNAFSLTVRVDMLGSVKVEEDEERRW